MADEEYRRTYDRAISGVEGALSEGKILLPPNDDRDRAVLAVAEYFMNALGVNPD